VNGWSCVLEGRVRATVVVYGELEIELYVRLGFLGVSPPFGAPLPGELSALAGDRPDYQTGKRIPMPCCRLADRPRARRERGGGTRNRVLPRQLSQVH
jgi:hypothetical protein